MQRSLNDDSLVFTSFAFEVLNPTELGVVMETAEDKGTCCSPNQCCDMTNTEAIVWKNQGVGNGQRKGFTTRKKCPN